MRSEYTGAPIAVMIYRRPEHLRRTLAALLENEGIADHDIHVFADGPRMPADIPNVNLSRQVAQEMLGERATYHFSQDNKGLATSIIAAVDMLTERYGDVIVIEDDLILDKVAINFLQGGLDHYRSQPEVLQVSAHGYDLPEIAKSNKSIFLPFTTSWGWATWQRAWKKFDPAASGWQELSRDKAKRQQFNLSGAYDYYSMLAAQMKGKRDSWAIRWYWSVFQINGIVAFPPYSLIRNTGFDGSGTHGGALLRKFGNVTRVTPQASQIIFNMNPKVNPSILVQVTNAIYKQNGGIIGRVADSIKKLVS